MCSCGFDFGFEDGMGPMLCKENNVGLLMPSLIILGSVLYLC